MDDTPLIMTRGDTPSFTITVTGYDLRVAGTKLRFTARDLNDAVVIHRSTDPGDGITVNTGATTGPPIVTTALLKLDATDTSNLLGAASLRYDIELTEAAGAIVTVAKGDLLVEPDQSR